MGLVSLAWLDVRLNVRLDAVAPPDGPRRPRARLTRGAYRGAMLMNVPSVS